MSSVMFTASNYEYCEIIPQILDDMALEIDVEVDGFSKSIWISKESAVQLMKFISENIEDENS